MPSKDSKANWEVVRCDFSQAQYWLDIGYEPFAATSVRDRSGLNVENLLFLRRKISAPRKKPKK